MTPILKNVEIEGDKLKISISELNAALEACISIMKESKANNDYTQWLIAAGYGEAMKDILRVKEGQ